MGYYRDWNLYAAKFEALGNQRSVLAADKQAREQAAAQRARYAIRVERFQARAHSRYAREERRPLLILTRLLERITDQNAKLAMRRSKRAMVAEIYSQYIPTKQQYKNSRKLSKTALKTIGRLTGKRARAKAASDPDFAGAESPAAYMRAVLKGQEVERVRARRRVGFSAIQKAHRQSLRIMQEKGVGTKAWKRTQVLINSESGDHGWEAGSLYIVLRNNARNKKGGGYSIPRRDLGTLGHRRNSIWTRVVDWQTEALESVHDRFNSQVAAAIHKAINQ